MKQGATIPHSLRNGFRKAIFFCVLTALAPCQELPGKQVVRDKHLAGATWSFAVSGDSRNCGDVVMPGIAAEVLRDHAAFYWHLGDFRWIAEIDEDFAQLNGSRWNPLNVLNYERSAWDDFLQHQIKPFGTLPIYLGIGNHETLVPKSRGDFVLKFTDWLNAPAIKQQRLADDPNDHEVRTYYHWQSGGVDFINLDNATHNQFDSAQVKWLEAVLARDRASKNISTVVVGMHEALPDSIAIRHSMGEWALGESSGRQIYLDLLDLQNKGHKKVYVLASHSHYFMEGIFDTAYWRAHGGVLPGWIIGTAGAVRYRLPEDAKNAQAAQTDVYGYLLATVTTKGAQRGTISFEFKPLPEENIPPEVVKLYGSGFVHQCFVGNRQ
jgi:hypothetical protein